MLDMQPLTPADCLRVMRPLNAKVRAGRELTEDEVTIARCIRTLEATRRLQEEIGKGAALYVPMAVLALERLPFATLKYTDADLAAATQRCDQIEIKLDTQLKVYTARMPQRIVLPGGK